jgi:hypothetical protein
MTTTLTGNPVRILRIVRGSRQGGRAGAICCSDVIAEAVQMTREHPHHAARQLDTDVPRAGTRHRDQAARRRESTDYKRRDCDDQAGAFTRIP